MSVFLGIDIGMTKISVVVYDAGKEKPLTFAEQEAKASCPTELLGAEEQNPNVIFAILKKLFAKIPAEFLATAEGIGVTGQLHGVVLRTKDGSLSNLITGRDRRASFDGSLLDFTSRPGCSDLRDGFGFTTLAWLAANRLLTTEWVAAGTLQDLLTMELCGLTRPMIDHCDAASWGLFNLRKRLWDQEALDALGIPERLLPDLVAPGSKAGCLCRKWAKDLGLKAGIPITVATGDRQAALLLLSGQPERELYLTVGNNTQLAVVLKGSEAFKRKMPSGVELHPYFDGKFLATVSPLCGGESFAWLVKSLHSIMKDFGISPPKETETYKKLDELAMRSLDSGLHFSPSFIGERHDWSLRGSLNGIRLDNFTAGALMASMAEGLLSNMKAPLPDWLFEGRERILGSGSALRRLLILQTQARRVFKMPLTVSMTREEAACGAAKLTAAALTSPGR